MTETLEDPFLTPRELGFRMPAEWAPHAATWLTWPRPEGISFPDKFEPIPPIWARLALLLSERELVHINYFSEDHRSGIEQALHEAGAPLGTRIQLHHFPAYEPWC